MFASSGSEYHCVDHVISSHAELYTLLSVTSIRKHAYILYILYTIGGDAEMAGVEGGH